MKFKELGQQPEGLVPMFVSTPGIKKGLPFCCILAPRPDVTGRHCHGENIIQHYPPGDTTSALRQIYHFVEIPRAMSGWFKCC